jgi:hypothetical protein
MTDNAKYSPLYVGLHEVISHVSGLAFIPSKTLSIGTYRCIAGVSVRNISKFGEGNLTSCDVTESAVIGTGVGFRAGHFEYGEGFSNSSSPLISPTL